MRLTTSQMTILMQQQTVTVKQQTVLTRTSSLAVMLKTAKTNLCQVRVAAV